VYRAGDPKCHVPEIVRLAGVALSKHFLVLVSLWLEVKPNEYLPSFIYASLHICVIE